MAEQPQQKPAPADRVAAIAAVLAGGTAASGAAAAAVAPFVLTAAILSALVRLLGSWRYRRATIKHTVRVLTVIVRRRRTPPPQGPAARADARNAPIFTAWFLERSSARVEAAYAAGAEPGAPEEREQRYLEQHLDAQERRRAAAERVDAEASKDGNVTDAPQNGPTGGRVILKWRAHPDDRTTIECRAADGAWFYADTPPVIGYPGMPHGGTCRCWSTHAGSLAEVARGRHVNEAVRGVLAAEPDHRAHPGAIPRRRPRSA